MCHMQPEISHETWITIDGRHGAETFPASLVQLPFHEELDSEAIQDCLDQWAGFTSYVNSADVHEIDIREGFGARFSAPGYMDATDWTVFETEQEAIEFLLNDSDPDNALEDWATDLLDRLYEIEPNSNLFADFEYFPWINMENLRRVKRLVEAGARLCTY